MVKGIIVSEGIGMGQAHWLSQPVVRGYVQDEEQGEDALELFRSLIAKVENDIEELIALKRGTVADDILNVFEAHILMLKDPMFSDKIEEKIKAGYMIQQAISETESELVMLFSRLDDAYLRERAADIKDISQRILNKFSKTVKPSEIVTGDRDYILIARELTPSEVLEIDTQYVKGILTLTGGPTAHAAIVARSLGIPAVSGIEESVLLSIQEGDLLIIDALQGLIHIQPNDKLYSEYHTKIQELTARLAELQQFRTEKAITKNGKSVKIAINIGNPDEADDVEKLVTDGIGLFRTELFYANRQDWPTEEEQFQAYKMILEKAKGQPVIVRTLDIGGDKGLPYLTLKPEENPFMGLRAIRLCLNRPEIFRTQLRALLRVSIFGKLRIMFPMISGLQELREAKEILLDVQKELKEQGCEIATDIPIGIMIEIPAAAIQADTLAKEVDFFSIGTNDLVQYTLAVDRTNDQVNYLYDYFHPAVLRLIKIVIDAAHLEGKWVGMCGEMAGDPLAIPLLVVMGIDELSMSSKRVLKAKKVVRELNTESHQDWQRVLEAGTVDQVKGFISYTVLNMSPS